MDMEMNFLYSYFVVFRYSPCGSNSFIGGSHHIAYLSYLYFRFEFRKNPFCACLYNVSVCLNQLCHMTVSIIFVELNFARDCGCCFTSLLDTGCWMDWLSFYILNTSRLFIEFNRFLCICCENMRWMKLKEIILDFPKGKAKGWWRTRCRKGRVFRWKFP